MSQNLVELIRRHHAVDAPTALEVLKQAVDDHGELTDEDRRRAAELSGLPEAAVYGVSTFYDDLLAPRGERHVRVCTGTACFAAAGERHVEALRDGLGLELGERAADGSRLARRDRLPRLLPLLARGPRRRRRSTPGPASSSASSPATARAAAEPEWREPARRAGPDPARRVGRACAGRSPSSAPRALLAEVEAAEVRGRGGAGFPAGTKWRFARQAAGEQKFVVANGDEGDPGSYIDKYLMERSPELVLEGMALAGLAVGADHGFVLTRSEYPLCKPRAGGGGGARPRRRACSARTSSAAASPST